MLFFTLSTFVESDASYAIDILGFPASLRTLAPCGPQSLEDNGSCHAVAMSS
jgi:hypothetical protein